eukprot:966804-Rhodomonas_salina.1
MWRWWRSGMRHCRDMDWCTCPGRVGGARHCPADGLASRVSCKCLHGIVNKHNSPGLSTVFG